MTHEPYQRILKETLQLPCVNAIVEFGSSARNGDYSGDLDLLIILDDFSNRHAVFKWIDNIAEETKIDIAPMLTTADSLLGRLQQTPSFARHLAQEGIVYAQEEVAIELRNIFNSVEVTEGSLEMQFEELRLRLLQVSNPEILGGRYVTALGRMYSISRAGVLLQLTAVGRPNYDWRTAFKQVAELHPDLEDPIGKIEGLRPFFEALDGRRDPNGLAQLATQELYKSSLNATHQIIQRRKSHFVI